jgi:hypothetical protein
MIVIGMIAPLQAQTYSSDYIELKINFHRDISDCEVYLMLSDRKYQVSHTQVYGTMVTLYLIEGEDYELILNCEEYITLSPVSYDIIDERDLDISSDLKYKFKKGVLNFYCE